MLSTPKPEPLDLPIILGVALAWVLLFRLNELLFAHFSSSLFSSWIFLPAGLRILSVLVLGRTAGVGLFVGALATADFEQGGSSLEITVIALLSGLAPLVAVELCRDRLALTPELVGLTPKQLIILSLAGATANALLLNLYLAMINHPAMNAGAIVSTFVGDVTGTAILLYVAGLVSWTLTRRAR